MAKDPPEPKSTTRRPASQEIASAAALQEAFEVSDAAMLTHKIDEIGQLLWFPEGASRDTKHRRILRALELYESLQPADGAEGMLAMQMVGTHDAALECLRRAALPNQTFEGRDLALKHAQRLMALYTQQLTTLNKHRGKGQQKVTVEHVTVEHGGQAIVGTVEAGQRGPRQDGAGTGSEHEGDDEAAEPIPTGRGPRKGRRSG